MTTPRSLIKPELSQMRLAVLDSATQRMLATVLLSEQTNGQIGLTVSGEKFDSQAVAVAAQEAATGLPPIGLPIAERLNQLKGAIRTRLLGDGFQVHDLPNADFALTVEYDIKSGRTIGLHKALHDWAKVDGAVVSSLHAAMVGMFAQGSKELAAEVERFVDADDHNGAAEAVKAGRQGMGFFGALSPELADALEKIRVVDLDADTRRLVRECRMAVAAQLERYDMAEDDASALLQDGAASTNLAMRAHLENVIAIASVKRGEIETALSIWRKLLEKPELLDPLERAWVWRNLSMALPEQRGEAVRAARLSTDAFLEAGDKREAATSLMHISRLLEFESPSSAIEQLDGMLAIITQNGLMGSELRAAIHHARGNRLRELRAHPDALDAALKAVDLRRGVSGVEDEMISSLYLAVMEAEAVGNSDLAHQLKSEAREMEAATSSIHFEMAHRIEDLFSNFDRDAADKILSDARALGDMSLIAGAGVAASVADPNVGTTSRLRRLETTFRDLERGGANEDAKRPVMMAIAVTLRDDDQFDRATTWLRSVLESHPLALDARDMLVDILWRSEDWGEAAIFLKTQIDLHGEAPGLLYAYGKSLLEAGNISASIPILSQGLNLTKSTDTLHSVIAELRERALNLGGTITLRPQAPDEMRPVLRDELEQALREFSIFIAAEKRMGFWKTTTSGTRGDHVWISHPEQRAQDLLHTFLKARFQSRISLFEELGTGAGRLDLFLRLDSGLCVIVELKMCGFGYSSAYAASGEEQIRHYMQNRSSHIGYLVVFDSRLDIFGTPLVNGDNESSDTICEFIVDVRPRVSARSR